MTSEQIAAAKARLEAADPRVSPWARRFVDEDSGDVRDVTPSPIPNMQSAHRAARDAHLRSFRNRTLNCAGSALLGIFVPPLALLAWVIAVGWGIAAGLSAFETLFAQAASAVGVDPAL